MENNNITNQQPPPPSPPPPPLPPQKRLVDVEISNQNDALQLLVNFLNLAQKRGAFNIDESAKIWECIKYFQ